MFACSFLSFFLAAKFFCHLRLSSLSLRLLKLFDRPPQFCQLRLSSSSLRMLKLLGSSSSVEALDLAVAVFDDVASSSSS